MIFCWCLHGEPSVGAGSWPFLGWKFCECRRLESQGSGSDKSHSGSLPEALPYPCHLGFSLLEESSEL